MAGQNVSVFVPEVYSQKLLKESKELTDFKNNMVNTDYEGEIKMFGDTVHICTPNLSNIVIGTSLAPTANEVAPTELTLTIDKKKSFKFLFNDLETAQSQFNMMDGYMSAGNEQMLIEVNQELELAVLDNADIPLVEGATAHAPFACTPATINKFFNRIKRTLVKNKALNSAGYYTFAGNKEQTLQLQPVVTISTGLFEELVSSTTLTHPTVQGDDLLYKGVCGQIAGMQIFVDTLLDTISSTDTHIKADDTTRTYVAIAGTKMGITFAEQYNKVEKFRDPDSFADVGRALYIYGYKITNPKSLVKAHVIVSES